MDIIEKLNNNKLSKDEIDKIVKLNFYSCGLVFFPESCIIFSNLTELVLSLNIISDIPESFGNLVNLRKLFLWENHLEKILSSV